MTVNDSVEPTTVNHAELVDRRNQELRRVTEPNQAEAELTESDDRFDDLAGFVEWTKTITTKPPGFPMSWCEQWDQHSREKEVLAALWKAYEKVKEEPTEYLSWLHYHFKPLIEEMIQPNGPLSSCRTGHKPPNRLGAT